MVWALMYGLKEWMQETGISQGQLELRISFFLLLLFSVAHASIADQTAIMREKEISPLFALENTNGIFVGNSIREYNNFHL
jgi:hypothetical protein